MPNKNTNPESGRSLIEIVGVLAIGAIMIAGTFHVYQSVRARQTRMIAAEDLRDIARKSRLLFAAKNDYAGISVGYLIKMGAIKTTAAPAVATAYDIRAEADGDRFLINLSGVNFSDCVWAATQYFDWADEVRANDMVEGSAAENCNRGTPNKVTIIVR